MFVNTTLIGGESLHWPILSGVEFVNVLFSFPRPNDFYSCIISNVSKASPSGPAKFSRLDRIRFI